MHWKKLSQNQIKELIADALSKNVDFHEDTILGIPASHLDENVFYSKMPFLKDAPYLTSMIKNPNHIGCHTLAVSEAFFSGTQQLEKELLTICAEDIFKAEANSYDGYVAAGGTEANIQAMWTFRNYFMKENNAPIEAIGIICSTDTHYSIYKAANLLNLKIFDIKPSEKTKMVTGKDFLHTLQKAKASGIKYMINVANMMTTMFGSVDDVNLFATLLGKENMPFKLHVDGAFGGFVYPFSHQEQTDMTFLNPAVDSISLDAHKMVQAPYGTGIFLCRKGLMKHVITRQAQYIEGLDSTLSGSRSGANAIAVWMILSTYGPHGWYEKIRTLMERKNWLCRQLDKQKITYYNHPYSNIVALKADFVPLSIANKFGLVPDKHDTPPEWYKIVIMEHVTVDILEMFLGDLVNK